MIPKGVLVENGNIVISKATLERWKEFYMQVAQEHEMTLVQYLFLGKADVCVDLLKAIEEYD